MKNLLKKEILVGIIVWILATFLIQPMFQVLWKLFVIFSQSTYSGWLDKIYKVASQGITNRVELILLAMTLTAVVYFMTPALLSVFQNETKLADAHKKNGESETKKLQLDDEQIKLVKAAIEIKTLEAEIKKLDIFQKILKSIMIITYTGFILYSFVLVLNEFAYSALNSSFNQRLTVLAVKISDQEYKEFKALWSTMENRQDYIFLNKKMDSVAAQQQIELPEPLLR